jgi:type IV pilus assembly protein PilY1
MIVAAAQRKHQMKSTTFMPGLRTAALVLAGVATMSMTTGATAALTPLADQPISIADVPANVMLALSVEFPTAITRAHQEDGDTFVTTNTSAISTPTSATRTTVAYFEPAGFAGANYTCSGQWSGNFMNWATMQGIDTFRWVLTGACGSPTAQAVRQRQRLAARQDHPAAGLRIETGAT